MLMKLLDGRKGKQERRSNRGFCFRFCILLSHFYFQICISKLDVLTLKEIGYNYQVTEFLFFIFFNFLYSIFCLGVSIALQERMMRVL